MGTLSFFEEAKIHLKKNNYLESKKLFEKAIQMDGLEANEKIFAYERIEQILRSFKKELSIDFKLNLIELYKDSNNPEKCKKFLLEIYEDTNEEYFLKQLFETLKDSGQLKDAKIYGKKYIELLIQRKRPDEIMVFLNQYRSFFEDDLINQWRISSLLLSGDRNQIHEWSFENSVNCEQIFLNYAEKRATYWQTDKKVNLSLLEVLINPKNDFVISKKLLAKLVFSLWMEESINQDFIKKTIILCERYRLWFVGAEIASYLEDYKLASKFENKIEQDLLIHNVDLGRDLFDAEVSEEDKVIARVDFLKATQHSEEEIDKELKKLIKINKDHPYLKKRKKEEQETNSEEIYKRILNEIQIYTNEEERDDGLLDGTSKFATMAKYYSDDYIQENFENMIVGLNLLDLSKVAKDVIERVDKKRLSEEEQINLEYLNLETLFKLEDFFHIRDLVEDAINNLPIKGEELNSFLYLKAESYYYLGKFKEAYWSYLEIKKLNSNYRLVNQRLKELEKYK
jgi:hypothetical protein